MDMEIPGVGVTEMGKAGDKTISIILPVDPVVLYITTVVVLPLGMVRATAGGMDKPCQ